jgi:hypothetical protein
MKNFLLRGKAKDMTAKSPRRFCLSWRLGGFLLFSVFFVVNTIHAQTNPLIEKATQVWKSGKPEQAANMLNGPAEAGNLQAQMLMGEIHEQNPAPASLQKARNWYARAAVAEHAPAQLRLSRLLRSENLPAASTLPAGPLHARILAGQTSHAAAADYWLQRAANLGDGAAQYELAQQYEAQQKIPEALLWYEKAVEKKFPAALNTLGVLLWQGEIVTRDTARAAQLYQQSAELGHAPAMFNLAGLIAQGQAEGDTAHMLKLLRNSAAQGYGKAQLQLARMLLYGDQVDQDEREAARLFHAAAKQNIGWAQYYFAVLLQKGRGITRNLEASRHWFELAAQANIPPAQYELGLIYRGGFGVVSDEKKGNQLIEQAASAGLPEAKAYLEQLNSTSTSSPAKQ